MAHDAHANALIKSLKQGVKNADALMDPYLQRFIRGNEVPTKKDVEDFKKALVQAQQLSNLMWADVNEVEHALGNFGGPADTWFSSYRQTLQTLNRNARG